MSAVDNTDAVFLSTFTDVWVHLTLWTMGCVGLTFFGAGVLACRVGDTGRKWMWVPLTSMFVGMATGFLQGCIASALVSALYNAIPYDVGIDIAAGLGIGQGLVIVYFHLGRADFVHR